MLRVYIYLYVDVIPTQKLNDGDVMSPDVISLHRRDSVSAILANDFYARIEAANFCHFSVESKVVKT